MKNEESKKSESEMVTFIRSRSYIFFLLLELKKIIRRVILNRTAVLEKSSNGS